MVRCCSLGAGGEGERGGEGRVWRLRSVMGGGFVGAVADSWGKEQGSAIHDGTRAGKDRACRRAWARPKWQSQPFHGARTVQGTTMVGQGATDRLGYGRG